MREPHFAARPSAGWGGQLTVLLAGLALAGGWYAAFWYAVAPDSLLWRFQCKSWAEYAETALLAWALAALVAKSWRIRSERAAMSAGILPEWNGQIVPVASARKLLDHVAELPAHRRRTRLARRIADALAFVLARRSLDGFDAHLHHQADVEAEALDSSYGLPHFLAWAIPLVGLLGTVFGIVDAVGHLTPEQLGKSLSSIVPAVVGAFDSTALGLAYAVAVMFLTFVVERMGMATLAAGDGYVATQLAHRFERVGPENSAVLGLLRQTSEEMLNTTAAMMERQATVWNRGLDAMRSRLEEIEKEQRHWLTGALSRILEQTVAAHQQRLDALEQNVAQESGDILHQCERIGQALKDTARTLADQERKLAEQTGVVGRWLDSEQQILAMQETLTRNLQALAQAGKFEQVLHSLTAAIHMLSTQTTPGDQRPALLLQRARQGKAA